MWSGPALFDYHDRPDGTLYRHCAALRICAHTCLWCNVASLALIADFLSSYEFYERVAPPWVLNVVPLVMGGLVTIGILLFPVMVVATPLTRDICAALAARGLPLPEKRIRERDIARAALKMCLWAAALVLCASLKSKL